MINYQDPYISVIESESDFDKIGEWTVEKMGLNPFIYVSINGTQIPTYSDDLCHETQGDCMKWINSYLKISHTN